MVRDLLDITPIDKDDVVLDAGSGKNKVWYNNLDVKEKYECEQQDGCNFYEWELFVDWVVGNPPFHESWKFTEKAISIANKGVAFLVNNQALNSHMTPARLDWLKEQGFECTTIHVVNDKRWFGRYYYLIFQKTKGILSWERQVY